MVVSGVLLVACGSGPSSSQLNITSGVVHRAFVSNNFAGTLQIIDANKNQISTHVINISPSPTFMVESPDRTTTLVFSSSSNSIDIVSNTAELSAGTIPLPDFTESVVIVKGQSTGYAAVPNAGLVELLDLASHNIPKSISIPKARWLSISSDGSKVLVFSDGSNDIHLIKVSDNSVTAITGTGLDHPIGAVFSADNGTAYVLSCGPECGGTQAKVTALNMSTLTLGTSVNVEGATTGFLNNGSLYVAGTCGTIPGTSTSSCTTSASTFGRLTVVNPSSMSASPALAISNGFHDHMALTPNGKLYIGASTASFSGGAASTCSSTQGCLSIYDTAAQKVSIQPQNCSTAPSFAPCGAVTGIAPITGNNNVYIIMGGELVIYDDTVDQPLPQQQQVDVVGKAFDVKEIDQ